MKSFAMCLAPVFVKPKRASDPASVIVTGPSRSGKTLAASLLNRLPDIIALSEPLEREQFKNRSMVLKETIKFFQAARVSLLQDGTATSKRCDGFFQDRNRHLIRFPKSLSREFVLVVEQGAPFTALLPALSKRYACYAMVRNPLDLLAAWNQLESPIGRGNLPNAERLDARLSKALLKIPGAFDRQIRILSWFFEQYLCLPPERVLTYENLLASGGKSLGVLNRAALQLEEPLSYARGRELEECGFRRELGERLLGSSGVFWKFYSKEAVEVRLKEVL